MPTIYLYARTSTKEQRYGLETQRQFLQDNIPESYTTYTRIQVDEQVSGKTLQGRVLGKIIDSLQEGDALFAYDASRLSRETSDLLNLVKTIHDKRAHLVIGLLEIDPHNYEQELQLAVSGAVATYQRRVQNAKSLAGIKVAKTKGDWIYRGDLYGYRRVRGNEFVKVPKEAAIVKDIFEQYAKGASINSLAKKYKETMGLHPATIRRIIMRPVYAGYIALIGPGKGKSMADLDLSDDNLIKSNVYRNPIITKELFLECQKSYRHIKRKHAQQYRYRYSAYQLTGILRCGYCRKGYVHCFQKYNTDKPATEYYTCRVHDKECSQTHHSFQSIILQRLFAFLFGVFLTNPKEIEEYYKKKIDEINTEEKGLRAKIDLLTDSLVIVDEKVSALAKTAIAFGDSPSIAAKLKQDASRLDEERRDIESEIERIKTRLQNETKELYEDRLFLSHLKLLETFINATDEEIRDIYKEYIKSARIVDDKISVEYINGKRVDVKLDTKRGRRVQKTFTMVVSYNNTLQYGYFFDTTNFFYKSDTLGNEVSGLMAEDIYPFWKLIAQRFMRIRNA